MRRQSMFSVSCIEREKVLSDFLNNSINCNSTLNLNQNDDDKKSLQTYVISNKTDSSFDDSKSKEENENEDNNSEECEEDYNLKSLDKYGLQLEIEENNIIDSLSKIEITTPFQIKNMYEKFNQLNQSNGYNNSNEKNSKHQRKYNKRYYKF